ncbi:IS1634 family transposase [Nitrincola sp. MINF-07-Sa-05]|uniref:IS1634 family transposase n=1 Tax=Nitrincola salilacus TaxID=3400273 RepID=UPI003917BFF6
MFVKVTTSGPRKYVQLVEAYRDENGRPKQRTIATLGRLDKLGDELESVVEGLCRITGRSLPDKPDVAFESSRALGDVWALTQLWNALGFDQLRKVFRGTRHSIQIESLIRIMVMNRLTSPDSKLGVLRWLETVCIPGVSGMDKIDHQHLLRAMDALNEHQAAVNDKVTELLRPLIDQELSVVFYDMTTIRAEGLTQQANELRQYGRSKEGGIRRQVMLGMVQTADGLPLYHEVFEGNTAEVKTLQPTVQTIIERFPVKRIIVVADRGLLSIDNLEELQQITLPSGQPLEFILAVPGRRYGDFEPILEPLQSSVFADATAEVITESKWQKQRLIIAHDPRRAADEIATRDARIEALEQEAERLAAKLDRQDEGEKARGRKLSGGGATARLYKEVSESGLAKIVKVNLKSPLFSYDVDASALQQARLMDGKLLLVTNVQDLAPDEVVRHYKSLADIERGFKALKSDIEIGPVYHRLPERIRAHAMICFIALVLHRVMRMRLKAADSAHSPMRALAQLRRIQYHQASLNGSPVTGLSSMTSEQLDILKALNIEKPTVSTDYLSL